MDDQNRVENENLIDDQVLNDLADQSTPDVTTQTAPSNGGLIPAPEETKSDHSFDGGKVPTAHEILAQKQSSPSTTSSDTDNDGSNSDEPEEPNQDEEKPDDKATDKPVVSTQALGTGNGDDDELLEVKKKALEDLSPLVDKLDLQPEEKFTTIMEILQASDDRTLVKPALETAESIEDEAKRAQALLDVVNEVNYLTQDEES